MEELEKGQSSFEVFISYSHKDEDLNNQLIAHLSGLTKDGTIECWHDRKIGPGDDWKGTIDTHLEKANLLIFLVSSDFIASRYCYDVEVRKSMERYENGEAHVIPVILRPCDWKNLPFGKLQALPKDGIAVTDWSNRDKAFLNIVEGIRSKFDELRKPEEPARDLAPTPSPLQPSINSGGSTNSRGTDKGKILIIEISGVKLDENSKKEEVGEVLVSCINSFLNTNLTLLKIEIGSIKMYLEGTREDYEKAFSLLKIGERIGELTNQLSERLGREIGDLEIRNIELIELPVSRGIRTKLSELEKPEELAILPNQKIQLVQPKQVNYSKPTRQEIKDGLTWGLKQLNIPELWETTQGEGINVAVLDTGVYGEHPALRGRVKDFIMIDPLRRRITAEPIFDSGQHGTHVCGTIAGGKTSDGVAIGVAPKANLLVAGIFEGNMTLLTLMEGISWAVEKGADIINISIGFSYYEPFLDKVFEDLVLYHEVLPVVAIGNEYHGNSSSPGNLRHALAVGAVEKMPRGRIEIASFSGGASRVSLDQVVTKPDVVAPGMHIYSCIPPEKGPDGISEYIYMDGTSMATAHVAGVAALLMSARREAAAFEIFTAMKETAKHPAGKNRRPDNRWGYGMIRPGEALKKLIKSTPFINTKKNDKQQRRYSAKQAQPELARRLHHLKPGQKIRAIVMLHTENAGIPPARTSMRGQRQVIIDGIRKSTASALPDLDRILERFNGKRLATSPDVLGCIPIETTADGINALAASEHIKTILEDQPISLIL